MIKEEVVGYVVMARRRVAGYVERTTNRYGGQGTIVPYDEQREWPSRDGVRGLIIMFGMVENTTEPGESKMICREKLLFDSEELGYGICNR